MEIDKLIITGAGGFIGSHLTKNFSTLFPEAEIIAIDNKPFKNWQYLNQNVRNISADFHNIEDKDFIGCNLLIHAAALKHSHVNNKIASDEEIFKQNILDTYSLLQKAKLNGVKKVIFASSLYVYGNDLNSKSNEDLLPNPDTAYGISKLSGENIVKYLFSDEGFSYNILRLYFVYGMPADESCNPFNHYKSFILKSIKSVKEENRISINGQGEQVMNYIYIDDVINAFKKATMSTTSGVYNISAEKPVKIIEVANIIRKILGNDNTVMKYNNADETQYTVRDGENLKAKEKLGWYPKTDINEGIEKTYRGLKLFIND